MARYAPGKFDRLRELTRLISAGESERPSQSHLARQRRRQSVRHPSSATHRPVPYQRSAFLQSGTSRQQIKPRLGGAVRNDPPIGQIRHSERVRSRRSQPLPTRCGRWIRKHPKVGLPMVAAILLIPIWWSLASALTDPSLGTSIAARAAEWVRDHGGRSVVVWAENAWYSHNAPPVGGIPAPGTRWNPGAPQGSGDAGIYPSQILRLPTPAPLAPFAASPLPGEGRWKPAGRTVQGVPAVYETFVRPDAVHTGVVDAVAWMDTKLLSATLYSGSYIPGGGPWEYTAPIKAGAAQTLVAAFNAGFRMQDANGGYFTQDREVFPLRTGAASFVIYANGTVNIGAWGTDVSMNPDVVSVRQNLVPLVENGNVAPNLNSNDTNVWGNTLGARVYVWRSGVGITSDGALVYVGGPDLNITNLANLLVRAGAVRAMELDINTDWVNFATFDPATPGGLAAPPNGTDLLANMSGSPGRYFATWWARDFFTMSARALAP